MKAVLCKEFGPPGSLVIEEVPPLDAGPGQVVVSVKAAGVNFPDVLMIQGKYQFQPPMPFSPGGEVSGIVKEIGDGAEGFKVGDEVVAMTGSGGFAEEVACAPHQLMPKPGAMDFVTAAGFSLTYRTSHYALRARAALEPGETLLVLGAAGGVGLSAVELGDLMGARVIAAASTDEKLAICRKHGADEAINYEDEDLRSRIKELTGGRGVDVVYDPVGGAFSEAAVRGMAWGGRFLVIGFASGDIPRIPLNLPLLKSCSIVGVFWGMSTLHEAETNQKLLAELVDWIEKGKVKPYVSATYPLEAAADALTAMLERKVHGKVVLTP